MIAIKHNKGYSFRKIRIQDEYMKIGLESSCFKSTAIISFNYNIV